MTANTQSATNTAQKRSEYLSVVIPAYNESRRLPRTLTEILSYLENRFESFEVIVVDDKSTDGTCQKLREFLIAHPCFKILLQGKKLGKGAAVRRGCMEARGDYVLFMDADHATPLEEVELMCPMLDPDQRAAVVGVRTYQEDESRWRRVLGLVLQLLTHLFVFKKAVIDSQCGFKLFTKKAIRTIFPLCRINGGMFDVELFYLMHKHKIQCFYHPVHWKNKPGSTIRLFRCLFMDPIDLLKIRLFDFLKHYQLSKAQTPC